MISFRQKGDFHKLTRYLERVKEVAQIGDLDKYGRQGVAALASATPRNTGKTANSWNYEIKQEKGSVSIRFYNTNIQMEFQLQLSCSMDMELVTEAGYRVEIISILLFSLFLTKLSSRRGRRLQVYEYNC